MTLDQLKASVTEISTEELMAALGVSRNNRAAPVKPTKRVGGKKKAKAKADAASNISPEIAAAMRDLLGSVNPTALAKLLGEE